MFLGSTNFAPAWSGATTTLEQAYLCLCSPYTRTRCTITVFFPCASTRAACQVGAEVQRNKTILVSQVGAEVQQKKKKTILVRILRWLMKWMLEMGTRFIKAEKVEAVLLFTVQKF